MRIKPQEAQLKAWEELYASHISGLEYKEICTNIKNFFSILREWTKESNNRGIIEINQN